MSVAKIEKQPRLRRALRALWLVCVFGLTLEIAARLDDRLHYDAPVLGNYDFDQLVRSTDRGFRGVPHGRYLSWSLNGDGLRGPEVPPDIGQTRVLVYGASEAFGVYEDDGKEFPRVLESELNALSAPDRYDVINAGIPGMRVGSGTSLMRELQQRFHPRVIVIYPTPTHYIGVSRPYCDRSPKSHSIEASPGTRSRIVGKVKDEAKRVLPLTALSALRKASIAWQMRDQTPLVRIDPASLEAFEADLHCALHTARELGMIPVLVTHANRFGKIANPDDAYWSTGWRLQYPELIESGFLDLEQRANKAIRKVALEERVKLVDAAAAIGGHPNWFADHAHFNNDGAAQMGALLAPAVLDARHALSR